jgi:hypothetical protein
MAKDNTSGKSRIAGSEDDPALKYITGNAMTQKEVEGMMRMLRKLMGGGDYGSMQRGYLDMPIGMFQQPYGMQNNIYSGWQSAPNMLHNRTEGVNPFLNDTTMPLLYDRGELSDLLSRVSLDMQDSQDPSKNRQYRNKSNSSSQDDLAENLLSRKGESTRGESDSGNRDYDIAGLTLTMQYPIVPKTALPWQDKEQQGNKQSDDKENSMYDRTLNDEGSIDMALLNYIVNQDAPYRAESNNGALMIDLPDLGQQQRAEYAKGNNPLYQNNALAAYSGMHGNTEGKMGALIAPGDYIQEALPHNNGVAGTYSSSQEAGNAGGTSSGGRGSG